MGCFGRRRRTMRQSGCARKPRFARGCGCQCRSSPGVGPALALRWPQDRALRGLQRASFRAQGFLQVFSRMPMSTGAPVPLEGSVPLWPVVQAGPGGRRSSQRPPHAAPRSGPPARHEARWYRSGSPALQARISDPSTACPAQPERAQASRGGAGAGGASTDHGCASSPDGATGCRSAAPFAAATFPRANPLIYLAAPGGGVLG